MGREAEKGDGSGFVLSSLQGKGTSSACTHECLLSMEPLGSQQGWEARDKCFTQHMDLQSSCCVGSSEEQSGDSIWPSTLCLVSVGSSFADQFSAPWGKCIISCC